MTSILQSLCGIIIFIAFLFALSENRSSINWRTVVYGLLLQFILAFTLIKVTWFQQLFIGINEIISGLETATRAGTGMVFGYLGGGELPFKESWPGASFILAFRALPIILVASALASLLFYWRILPWLIDKFAFLFQRTLQISGAVSLSAAANIFVGMVEAPLFVRPYLEKMTRSELFMLMSCGMATIAGTVMVLYASILGSVIPDAMGHILTASIISVPAVILLSLLLVPQTKTIHYEMINVRSDAKSSMDAVTQGTINGVKLLINIIAMLVVLVALVELVNIILGVFPHFENEPLTLQRVLGWIMAPIMWLIGIPWSEAHIAGSLMGIKTILNELLAYLEMASLNQGALGEKSKLVVTYALCGFANFGSLGILLGGLTTMVPSRRDEIVALGMKSILVGTLATLMTGAVVNIVLSIQL